MECRDFIHPSLKAAGALATSTAFTTLALAHARPQDLLRDQTYFYRITFQNLEDLKLFSDTEIGKFRTAPSPKRGIRLCVSSDTAGQMFEIGPPHGEMLSSASTYNVSASALAKVTKTQIHISLIKNLLVQKPSSN